MKQQTVISFADRLFQAIEQKKTPCIVGLDPRFSNIPSQIREAARAEYGPTIEGIARALFLFNQAIIDLVAPLVPAVKPQIAFYEMYGPAGMKAYLDTVRYARSRGLLVIADVKRNDIGSTVAAYSQAYLGTVPGWDNSKYTLFDADAVTVNPYLGSDGIKPFLDDCATYGKGIFILVKTSNPSSSEFQNLLVHDTPLYIHVARKCRDWGDALIGKCGFSAVGAVVGATYPDEAVRVRQELPQAFLLVPGFGAQGGTAQDILPFFRDGRGALINNSRGIIHAYTQAPYKDTYGEQYFEKAVVEALELMITQVRTVLAQT
ncbi:orotidine-5'-phosphate decarboxylase [bacterium]|nr:orotidine-5'-phosphate decarboxylase [bacterium]